MPDIKGIREQECPVCHAIVPVDAGYVPWCDRCNWNVHPQSPAPPRTLYESMYASLGRKHTREMLDRFLRPGALTPSLSLLRVLAFVVATLIHGITLGMLGLGLLVAIVGWPNAFALFVALLCLGIAWLLRPRLGKLQATPLSREQFPALFKLIDEVVRALDAPRVDAVVLDSRYNAAMGQIGWRRKRVLYLGLPLLAVLNDQERIAIIAHEVAHSVNGDMHRGLVVGSAIHALSAWYALVRPAEIWPREIASLLALPITLVMLALSSFAYLWAYVLSHLLWQDGQRAEYLADYLSANVSGADAALALLEKSHLDGVLEMTLHGASLRWDEYTDVFGEFRDRIAKLPPRELERLKRVGELEQSRLDASHPPTTYRMQLVRALCAPHPRLTLSASDSAQLEREVRSAEQTMQRELIDAHRAAQS